jgi:hypothetical protein
MTTHGETHQEWRLELQAAYVISRPEDEARFEPYKHDSNRRLLWSDHPSIFSFKTVSFSMTSDLIACPHQARQPHLQRDAPHPTATTSLFSLIAPFLVPHAKARKSNREMQFMGILSQGLRIAPPESPSTGYMFDKGHFCYRFVLSL